MSDKVVLDLPLLLPDALDGRDGCVDRLTATLTGSPGLEQVHVADAADGAPARLCMHYDPAATSVARIRSLAEAAGAKLTDRYGHVLWPVTGIGHVRKARTVAQALRRVDGVMESEVTPGLVRIEFDRTKVDEDRLRAVLGQKGVDVPAAGGEHEGHGHVEGEHAHGGPFGARSELIFAFTAAALWLVGFVLGFITDIPDGVLTGIFIAAGLFGGYFTAREAFDSVRNGRFEIDFLMLVAAAGAALLGKWEEGALLLTLFSVGHALEGYAMGRARRAIEALAELAPATALVRDDSGEREVLVEMLEIADIVIVKPNERIPADGFVVAGTSSVNQAPLTGESIPVDKLPVGDVTVAAADPERVPASSRLYSGTINGAGQLDLHVTRLAADTTLSKLATMVREAETQASPTQRFTDRFERIFVPAVIGLVIVVLVVGPALGSSWSESFYRAMAVLVAASPCALAIATPSAVLAAVARAGHDRRAWLVFGQDQFTEAGARARPQQANVVGDLEQPGGDRVDRAVNQHIGVVGGERFELVRRGGEGKLGKLGDLPCELFAEFRLRVEAGADSGPALRQREQFLHRGAQPRDSESDLRGIAGEFLSQRQRGRVLRMGPPDLDDLGECLF
ncbi:MAG: hypothetical protein WCF36_07885, partial [Candidatus Nanopelagicales bacterium]